MDNGAINAWVQVMSLSYNDCNCKMLDWSVLMRDLSWFPFNLVSFQNVPFSVINISHTSPQHNFIRTAMWASASPMYLRGWGSPCLNPLLITTKRLQLPAESQWWLFIFLPLWWSVRNSIKGSRGLLGMAASSKHISDYCFSWSFSLSPLWCPFTPPISPCLHAFHSLTHFRIEKKGAELTTPCHTALFFTISQPSFSSRTHKFLTLEIFFFFLLLCL